MKQSIRVLSHNNAYFKAKFKIDIEYFFKILKIQSEIWQEPSKYKKMDYILLYNSLVLTQSQEYYSGNGSTWGKFNLSFFIWLRFPNENNFMFGNRLGLCLNVDLFLGKTNLTQAQNITVTSIERYSTRNLPKKGRRKKLRNPVENVKKTL